MKLLLINVIEKDSDIESLYPPLGLGYIASYLKQNKKDVEVKVISDNIPIEVYNFNPDIVGISSVTQNFERAKEIAKICKDNGRFVIMGGVHISLMPENLNENMDVGLIGEAEETILELINFFEKNGIKKEGLENIKGLAFRKDNKLIITESRPLIEPLDKLPMPDRQLLNVKRKAEIQIISSRGCPYNCCFCSSSKFWSKVRFFSAEYVIKEIKYILETYNPYRINFFDDLFIADKTRLKKIVELIEQEKINQKLQFTVSARANLIDKETVDLLKRMNITIVNLGLESGSEKVLQYLKGTNISIEDSKRAINLLKDAHIETSASFIMGAPIETVSDLQTTYDFIKQSRLDLFDIYLLIPFPKTDVWNYALERGLVSNDMNWDKLNFNYSNEFKDAIILSEHMNQEDLWDYYKRFKKERKRRYIKLMIKSLYRRPKQIIPFLKRKLKR